MLPSVSRNKKIRQTGFLLVSLLFVTLVVYVAREYKSSIYTNVAVKAEEEVNIEDDLDETKPIAQQVEFEPEPYNGEVTVNKYGDGWTRSDTNFEIVPGEMVMGSATGPEGCKEQNPEGCESFTIAWQPVCSEAEVNFALDGEGATVTDPSGAGVTDPDVISGAVTGGLSVAKNAKIEIWKVTSPLPILSGSETIDTTAYSISYDYPNFYSGVKQVREATVAGKYVFPEDDKDELVAKASGADTEDFSVHVSIAGWGDAGTTEEDTIFKELDSSCPEIQPSDPNPDPSNKVTEHVMNVTAVPGEPLEPRDYGPPECIRVTGVDLPEADVFETCANQRTAWTDTIGAFIQAVKWAECIVNPGACTQTEIVGLLIDAPYGANHKCNEGFCSDQFLDNSLATTIQPGQMTEWTDGIGDPDDPTIKPYYVTTPCKIRVVDNVHNGIYDVPCIWDMSPYKAKYDDERNVREPGDETLPTWDEYRQMVIDEAKRRGAICAVSY